MADWARRYTWELLLAVILLGTIAFNISESSGYLGVDNFVNLFQLHIEKIIVVVTMTFVIISGEIDLSVASVMAWSASVLAALHERDEDHEGQRQRSDEVFLAEAVEPIGEPTDRPILGEHPGRAAPSDQTGERHHE